MKRSFSFGGYSSLSVLKSKNVDMGCVKFSGNESKIHLHHIGNKRTLKDDVRVRVTILIEHQKMRFFKRIVDL